jgi:hypothetical protein
MDRVVKETKREAREGMQVQRGFSTGEYIWSSAGMCWDGYRELMAPSANITSHSHVHGNLTLSLR